MHRFLVVLLLTALCTRLLGAAAAEEEPVRSQRPTRPEVELTDEALRIHRDCLVVDGHNDLPWELRDKFQGDFTKVDLRQPQAELMTDLPRIREGGLGAQFWSCYVPADTARTGGAARMAFEQIELIRRLAERYPDDFEMAFTADDVERIHRSGKLACLIGVEGGHMIENSLGVLRALQRLGARYLTLTHSDSLEWADSATDDPRSGGLSPFGIEVVQELNRLGMLVDISHISPACMHAALRASRAPVIASHSSAYGVAPHPRNVPDDVLAALKQNGGVVMVNFFSGFVVPESAKATANFSQVLRKLRAENPDPDRFRAAMEAWRAAHPMVRGSVHDVVDHIDHIVSVAGVEHVGLGSDYDGVPMTPRQLEDVSKYPYVTQELLNRGYTEEQIRLILGGNLLRALRAAERAAGP